MDTSTRDWLRNEALDDINNYWQDKSLFHFLTGKSIDGKTDDYTRHSNCLYGLQTSKELSIFFKLGKPCSGLTSSTDCVDMFEISTLDIDKEIVDLLFDQSGRLKNPDATVRTVCNQIDKIRNVNCNSSGNKTGNVSGNTAKVNNSSIFYFDRKFLLSHGLYSGIVMSVGVATGFIIGKWYESSKKDKKTKKSKNVVISSNA